MEFNVVELRKKFGGIHTYKYSDDAQQAVYDLLDRIEELQEGNQEFEVNDILWEVTDDAFMYYDDAWDYMKRYGDNDLKDAVDQGFHDISQIAWYNLQDEVYAILNDIGFDY